MDEIQRGGRSGDREEEVKGLRRTMWSQNSHRRVKYGIGTIISNTVITVSGARWALEISGGRSVKVYDCLT